MRRFSWGWWLACAAGALVCTACDHLHVVFGVLAYTHPTIAGQAWWVFPLFFVSAAGALEGASTFARLFDRKRERALAGKPPAAAAAPAVAVDALAFVFAYALTSFTHAAPNGTLVALVGLWWLLAVTTAKEERAQLFALSIALAIVGPGVEASLSAAGLFHYLHPDAVLVPRWLPGIYLNAAPLALSLARTLS